MFAVIFEVWPTADGRAVYLDTAAELRRFLETRDGFISIERFESMAEEGKLLSLSFWRDEASIAAWRNLAEHRAAQQKGRDGLFARYRIRVAEVMRDYGDSDRAAAPSDSLSALA